jgi:hypothetical protein
MNEIPEAIALFLRERGYNVQADAVIPQLTVNFGAYNLSRSIFLNVWYQSEIDTGTEPKVTIRGNRGVIGEYALSDPTFSIKS